MSPWRITSADSRRQRTAKSNDRRAKRVAAARTSSAALVGRDFRCSKKCRSSRIPLGPLVAIRRSNSRSAVPKIRFRAIVPANSPLLSPTHFAQRRVGWGAPPWWCRRCSANVVTSASTGKASKATAVFTNAYDDYRFRRPGKLIGVELDRRLLEV